MGIGPRVRRLLGQLERPAAELYRSVFVDLNSFVASISQRSGYTTTYFGNRLRRRVHY